VWLQTTNCSVIVSFENVPFQENFGGGILDGTFINAQAELYHNGDIELRWGTASLPNPPQPNEVFVTSFFDQSFFVQESVQMTGDPFLPDGTLPEGAYPTNQCRFFKLVKPDEITDRRNLGRAEESLTTPDKASAVESALNNNMYTTPIEAFANEVDHTLTTDAKMPEAPQPTPNSERALVADADYGFVEFGTYREFPPNQNCGAFSSLIGEDNNRTMELEIALATFGRERVSLPKPFPWYGFDTNDIVVFTEMTVTFATVADPRLGDPADFSLLSAMSAGIPLSFGRPGFVPRASDDSRIIVTSDDEKLIISWENIPFNVNGGTGFVNTQVVLYFNGCIEFRWGPAELPSFDSGQDVGVFRSFVNDNTFYVQDSTFATGAPIAPNGVWQAGTWPTNQCRFFELESR